MKIAISISEEQAKTKVRIRFKRVKLGPILDDSERSMHIHRHSSRLTFRTRTRRGCVPFVILIGLIVGFGAMSWTWLEHWFSRGLPGLVTADIDRAEAAFAAGDLNTAIELARAVLADEPDNASALILLGRSLIYRSYVDYDREPDQLQALTLAEQGVVNFPGNHDVLALQALALHVNGESGRASRTALRVIERERDNVLARVALALAYGGQGLFDVALRESQRAVELAAELQSNWLADAYRALAIAYSDLGQYDQAAGAVEDAMTHHRHLIPLYFERALYALQVSDKNAATVAYFQILAFDPDNVKARYRLCELSSSLRETEAALRYCEEVTQRAPGWSEGWYRLGREHFLQGQFELAQRALNRCSSLQVVQNVPIEQRRFECWYIQGQAAEIRGDCDSLIRLYDEFQTMAAVANLSETWTYPPEGPPMCAGISPDVRSTPLRLNAD